MAGGNGTGWSVVSSKIRWLGCLAAFMVCMLAIPSCTTKTTQGTIKIGAFLPLSGWAAEYGKQSQNGINLAVKEFNDLGGIRGKKIEVIFEDSAAEGKKAVSATKKLVEVDKVCALVGAIFTHEALPAAPIAQENKVPIVAGQVSHPDFLKFGPYTFSVHPYSENQMNVAADYAFKEKGIKRPAILAFDCDYGHDATAALKSRFAKLGGEVVFSSVYPMGTTDFKTLLLKVKDSKADAIAIIGSPQETVQILRQMAELGIKLPVFGSNMLREKTIVEMAGSLAEGAFYANPGPVSDEAKKRAQAYEENYKKTYGDEPRTVTSYMAYEAASLVLNAIKESGETGPEIQKWLAKVKDFPGATGEITFGPDGEAIRPEYIYVVENGKYVMTNFWSYGE